MLLGSEIANDYTIIKKLGSGAFGEVYSALHKKENKEYAVKIERIGNKSPQLFTQSKIIRIINGNQQSNETDHGIPRIYYCGSEGTHNVMVMDLFGSSLEDIFVECKRKFDVKTTAQIGFQMIQRIEMIHEKGFLHRDIKPDNFVMGKGEAKDKLYIIDFGLAKKYISGEKHIPYRDNKNLTGTARYASLNTHLGIQQGRRDDIEGIANVLIYFARGNLPWQNLPANNKKQKYAKIMEKKLSIPLKKLCEGIPEQYVKLIHYSRSIEFETKPDYQFLKGLFLQILDKNGEKLDYRYCWDRKQK